MKNNRDNMLVKRKIFKLFQVFGKNEKPLSDKKFLSPFDAKKYGETLKKDFYIQTIGFKSNDFWEIKG